MLRIDVITLFPGMLSGFVDDSIAGIAQAKGLVSIQLHNLRVYAENRWGKVDDKPYGGGPGMVLQCGPVYAALEAALGRTLEPPEDLAAGAPEVRTLLLTPQGRRLDQAYLGELAEAQQLVLVCGRYEGFDERVRTGLGIEEVSIGDFVLAGGEAAAAVVVEGVVRLVPGVLGDAESLSEESFTAGVLEYPHYTRPVVFRGMEVPEILRSGDHPAVARWREEQAVARTRLRRPDLGAGQR